jgi:hypothetical protein
MAVGRQSDGRIERRSAKVRATPKTADRERDDYIKQIREGTYKPWKKQQAPPKRVAVADFWPIYLRNYMNKGKTGAGRLEIAWNHLKPKFATVAVDDLSTALIEEYIEARRTDGVENATVNRELSCLRAMLIRGTKATPRTVTMVPAFPDRLAQSEPRTGFIKDAEYKTLAANAKHLWLRTPIACAYAFGFRKASYSTCACGKWT